MDDNISAMPPSFQSRERWNEENDFTQTSVRSNRKISDPLGKTSSRMRYRRQTRPSRVSTSSFGSVSELLRQVTLTSTRSSARLLQQYRIRNNTHANNLLDLLSGIYAMCLVVMGATLPVAKVFSAEISLDVYEGFYVYLYVIGMCFLIFVHVRIIHAHRPPTWRRIKQWYSLRRRKQIDEQLSSDDKQPAAESGCLTENNGHPQPLFSIQQSLDTVATEHVTYTMQLRTESFYLRLGAIVFGIASMIHTGLNLGEFLELIHVQGNVGEIVLLVRPVVQLIFTFVQLYFIFRNSSICIHSYKTTARFGCMHLIATNLCVWLRIITIEIVRELHRLLPHSVFAIGFHEAIGRFENTYPHCGIVNNCTNDPYNQPEKAVQFMIWRNISSRLRTASRDDLTHTSQTSLAASNRQVRQVNVDCSGANRGLFSGIIVLVLTIISIVVFLIYVNTPRWKQVAVFIQHSTQIGLYLLTSVVVVFAAYRFKEMKFQKGKHTAERRLDETLLVVSLSGVFLFRVFSSIAGHFTAGGSLVTAANVIIIIQATLQTGFLLNGLHREASTAMLRANKPGRDSITFLLLCNVAIWSVNVFEVLRSDSNQVSISFYGPVSWTIIAHVTVPLAIFHQFHATVCLSRIWKSAYKVKNER